MECNFQTYRHETNVLLGSDGWNVSLTVSENVLLDRRLEKALCQLPKSLDETYNRILNNIPKEYQREAHCVLHLLVISYRPLNLKEVAEAVAVDCENEIFDPEDRLRDPYDILEICSSLVSLSRYSHLKRYRLMFSSEENELRFAHYSVKEYLISERIPSGFSVIQTQAHQLATRISLIYFLSFNDTSTPSSRRISISSICCRVLA